MFDRKEFIETSLTESADTKRLIFEKCFDSICEAADLLTDSVRNGKKILLCGNGGSAADCQHLATEFMIRLSHDIDRPAIAAIALTTDTSNLTAGGNDIGFENVFSRNIEGLGTGGDILIAISTSGNSPNIIKAVMKAKDKGMKIIGLLGKNKGGKLKDICDVPIIIPSENTQRIQEGHITVGHILCEITERELYQN
ncbi:MAG TPA: D-sedoheptulose 7-phosphate isomerase [Ignavibacteria bacterium]|nr:phosphoheptose isomerase [Bacteroidota bacterium]HRI83959.1 D-sedoheptulose 7-phosphate isomerase [Ignavibacteria bacterium]HRJ98728.1 D-sedoheptulose 7-phosphate isomerase [Ignavibacteria bacterium]